MNKPTILVTAATGNVGQPLIASLLADGAQVREADHILQTVAIAQRLAEQFAGVEEEDGSRGIDLRDHVQQDSGFRAEGGNHRGLAREFLFQRKPQNALRIAV